MGVTVQAGAAVREVTPPVGTAMSGFVARTSPATCGHDPLTVRAVVVDDTAVLTVDVVGLHENLCAAVRRRCPLPEDNVVVHATHTHGGPASMPGRLSGPVDEAWLSALEDACVQTVAEALAGRLPATIRAGYGNDPDVARNRRRPHGATDSHLPVVRLVGLDGTTIAVLVSYACHPVVLGSDNTEWTADYPGVVRGDLEAVYPGGVALFLTGCAGDANTGHSAAASLSTAPMVARTFEEAREVGHRIAEAATAQADVPVHGPVTAAREVVPLDLDLPDRDALLEVAATWRAQATADDTGPATAALFSCWADWATRYATIAGPRPREWSAPVTVLRWGGVLLVAFPGEPFAEIALATRAAVMAAPGIAVTLVVGYTDGCPGYLPTADEYALGGYEVAEAHRYYGMPGPFAPSSAGRLLVTAEHLVRQVCPA